MFRRIGAATTEDSFHEGSQATGTVTLQGAQAEMARLQGDTAFVTRYLAGDVEARRIMDALHQQITGVNPALEPTP